MIARSLAGREQTLDRLEHEFLLAAPVALLLAILAGYGLAAAALRPVEAMRRRAEDVTAHEPGRRLPVPPARDEIRSLAVTLNDMLARLEAAFEHERRFLSDASHELRTPLALLRAELDLALRRRADPRGARGRGSICCGGDRAHDAAGGGPAADRPGRPRASAGQARGSGFAHRAGQRPGALRSPRRGAGAAPFVVDAPALPLRADKLHLEQALGNLVANAIEHGAGAVILSAKDVDGHVELHVDRRRRGMPPAFAERAFDRFSRADDARSGGGSGLGLAIVAMVARAHGGEAGVARAPGGGADAWIALPRSGS